MARPIFNEATASLQAKSDMIRALAHAGYLRTEIASLLGIRNQHARIIANGGELQLGHVGSFAAPYDCINKSFWTITRTGNPGRMVSVGWMLSWRRTICWPTSDAVSCALSRIALAISFSSLLEPISVPIPSSVESAAALNNWPQW